MNFTIHTLAEKPEWEEHLFDLHESGWPEFMLNDNVANDNWEFLLESFSDFQFFMCDDSERVIATGHSIPLYWNGSTEDLPKGWDGSLEKGVEGVKSGVKANTMSALSITVSPDYQGKSLSKLMVRAMKDIAHNHQFQSLLVPVRPSLKHRYPLIPMDNYAQWKQTDGLPFDPWLRVHVREGGQIIDIAQQSMCISGTIEEWEEWTGMAFPESGEYTVERALTTVYIDRTRDQGIYIEPNVWVLHRL